MDMTNEGWIARYAVAIEAQTGGAVDDYPGEQTGALKKLCIAYNMMMTNLVRLNASRG